MNRFSIQRIIFIVLCLFLIRCSNFSFSNIYKKYARKTEVEYYENGCPKHSVSFFNNHFDGPMLRWNENCILISETNYENGKLHGEWISYYNDGAIMHSVEYFFDQKKGFERWYYESGKISTEVKYTFDKKDSDILSWDESGNLLN